MLCAHLLRPESAQSHGRLYHAVGRGFDALLALYERGLNLALAWPKLTLAGFAATVALTAGLYLASPKGFFPPQDTGALQAITEAPGSISYAAMAERQQAMAALVQDDPAVASVASFIGVDAANPTLNTGRLLITLKPHAERDGAAVVARRLALAAQAVPGLRLYLQPVQDLTLEEGLAKTPYQFTLSGPDRGELDRATSALQQRLAALPQLRDVSNDQMTRGLQAHVEIDRDACARLGVSVTAINAALYNAFGQRPVSTIFTASQQLRVVLEADPRLVQGPQALAALHVPGTGGLPVPLASVARFTERSAPLALQQVAQFPAVSFSFDLAPGVALGEAVAAIRAEQAALNLPSSLQTAFQGSAQAFEASLRNTPLLVLAAIVTMYIVLGVLYESFIHPLTILSTLPSAGLGALLALRVSGQELGLIAIIGIVLLIAIVKKNAIMMIDFAQQARVAGGSADEAIRAACRLRFRPILMTTMAALLAAVPMMVGTGVGSELRHPLGITLVGGLVVSQLLTLFTTPVIYLGFDSLAARWAEWRSPSARVEGAAV
jgi:multidrug efflux pump